MAKKKVTIQGLPKFKDGGLLPNPEFIQVEDNNVKPLSHSFIQITGDSHKKGGEKVLTQGQIIEAEGGEPVSKNLEGDTVFWGKMKNPITGKSFRKDAQDLAKEENKATKQLNQATELILNKDPEKKFDYLSFSAGRVKQDAANQKLKDMSERKELYGDVQQMMLDYSHENNIDPKNFYKEMENGGKVKKKKVTITGIAQDGRTVSAAQNFVGNLNQVPVIQNIPQQAVQQSAPVPLMSGTYNKDNNQDKAALIASIRMAAERHNVDPNIFEKQIFQESGFNPKAKSKAGAKGIAQFMPATAREMGLDPNNLVTDNWNSIEQQIDAAARYMSQLKGQLNGDDILAAAAYNGGIKNIKGNLRELGRRQGRDIDTITGQDWYNFMSSREDKPKGQLETINYINNIAIKPSSDFWDDKGGEISKFREQYYIEQAPPPERIDIQPINTGIQVQPLPVEAPTANNVQPISQERISEAARAQPQDPTQPQPIPSLADRNRLNPLDLLPEIAAIFDRPDYVEGQQFNPVLNTPYRVSYQDMINQNQANFNRISNASNNPEAMATLAGQLYDANQRVYAEEFRQNQQIANTVANQNVGILNQAQLQNIQLADQQYVRQAQAQANTEANRNAALASISNKYAQHRAQNNDIRMIENLFNYRPDENMQLQNYNAPVTFNTQGVQTTPITEEQLKVQQERYRMEAQKARAERARTQALSNWFGRRGR